MISKISQANVQNTKANGYDDPNNPDGFNVFFLAGENQVD